MINIAVIGAGLAGLCAAKQIQQQTQDSTGRYNVTVYEQSAHIGGQWVYTDRIGKDDYGLDILNSMYKGLTTNSVKEMMGFPDFPMPDQENSYISAKDVLRYLEMFADHFQLRKLIQFQHHVVRVRPIGNEQWEVIVKDLPNGCVKTIIFDAIMVCNGHYAAPRFLNIPGSSLFNGMQMHSHDYRTPDMFRDKKVLVIGSGPSGLDIGWAIAAVARKFVLCSGPEYEQFFKELHGADKIKLAVRQFTETGAEFVDGTHQEFDVIMYCTGYRHSFPFLSVECGIQVDDDYVQPLYKQCINFSYPTMFFIGLQLMDMPFLNHYLQVRFCLCVLGGRVKLPSTEEMLHVTNAEMQKRWDKGYKKRQAHKLYEFQEEYYKELAALSETKPHRPVVLKIYAAVVASFMDDYMNYRTGRISIVDDDNIVLSFPSQKD